MREDRLCFRATPRQRTGNIVATCMAVAVTAGLAALEHGQPELRVWVFFSAACSLFSGWTSITLPQSFTEISPDGIRTGGTFGLRDCPWREVASIDVRRIRGGTRTIVVTQRDRSSFRLAVPTDRGPFTPDANFITKYDEIRYYWQEATKTPTR